MGKRKIDEARQRELDNYIREVYEEKNYLRQSFFQLFRDDTTKGKMDFPAHSVTVGKDTCFVYEIPPKKMQAALNRANHLKGDVFFPIRYRSEYKEAIILYFEGYNFIVRPSFFEDGKTSQGWGMNEAELTLARQDMNKAVE